MGLKILKDDKSLNSKKIIAVGSGKGGVGKSSITVCLAHVLRSLGKKVGVLDSDIYGPSLKIMLPLHEPLFEKEGWIFPAKSFGIKVMSIGYFYQNQLNPAIRAPIVNAMIKKFISSVNWGDLDILLIDLPPGTGDIHLTLTQSIALDGVIVVTTPQQVAISDVKKSLDFFQKMHVPILGIVENMSYFFDPLSREKHFIFGSGGGERLATEFGAPFLGQIPLESDLCEKLDNGKSIFEGMGMEGAKRALLEIGIEILHQVCDHRGQKRPNLEVRKINPHQVSIFLDGKENIYSYSDLQKRCPCARCVDPVSGISIVDEERLSKMVQASKIEEIGNYGLRFHFNSGCKQGIYTWEHLQSLCAELAK